MSKEFETNRDGVVLNVGWLARGGPFPFGDNPTPTFLDGLFELCGNKRWLSLGVHDCDFCPPESQRFGITHWRNGKKLWAGSTEMWVCHQDGTEFIAPNMIYHYVVEHFYKPPAKFIEAVLDPVDREPDFLQRDIIF